MAACRWKIFLKTNKNAFSWMSQVSYTKNANIKSASKPTEIVVPFRIERGPTDILKALESTISKDPLASHYKYEDDPYFIPCSNIAKRAFALSKESGKKAARHFLEQYPRLFVMNESVPSIKQFDPPTTYSEENVSSVDPLKKCIENCDVNNSLLVYQILKQIGIDVPHDVKLDLLELLCFYNSTQPPHEDYYEERYFQRLSSTPPEKWNLKGPAEKLFEELEKDERAYSAIIAGASKFSSADRAMTLFDEMSNKDLKPSLYAYNSLISIIHLLKEDYASRWELALFLLSRMSKECVKPDLYTMNNLLMLLCKSARWAKAEANALRVLSEMKKLDIEPSLGTYQHLLMLFCALDFSNSTILYEIFKHIEGKEFVIQHPSDVLFFATAMEVCWKGLADIDLAHRLHKLLETGKNCKLLGNSLSTSQYFKSFFMILCETEDVEKLMEVYEKYIPHTYTPEPSVTHAVVQAIHFNGMYKYLPRLCSDVLLFEQTERINILETLLEAAGCMKHEEKVQTDINNMLWNIMQKFTARAQSGRLPFEWTGEMLGNVLKTFINGKDIDKAWTILKKLKEEETRIIGYAEKEILLNFCELCLLAPNYEYVQYCIKYAVRGCYPDFTQDVKGMIVKMVEENRLEGKQKIQALDFIDNITEFEDDTSSSSEEDSSSDSSSEEDDEEETKENK